MSSVQYIAQKFNPDIIFISEAEIKEGTKWIALPNYHLVMSNTIKYGKSRLACFSKVGIDFKHIKIECDDLEIIALENNHVRIIGAYRPFKQVAGNTLNTYLAKLLETLDTLSSTCKELIIGGDFNINLNKTSHERDSLDEWSMKNDLVQLVNDNTWERLVLKNESHVIKESRLDLVFSRAEIKVKLSDKLTSDHKVVHAYSHQPKPNIIREKHLRRTWQGYNAARLKEEMIKPAVGLNAEALSNHIANSITAALDKICPVRVIRTARASDILDQTLEKLKKKRKRLLKEFNRSQNEHTASIISDLNKKIKKRISSSRKQQVQTKLQGSNSKCFWKVISDLEGSQSKHEIELNLNNKLTNDKGQLCEAFASFFENKVRTLSNNYSPSAMILQQNQNQNATCITTLEIMEASRLLKSKMCCGIDEIPMKIIKDLGTNFPEAFIELFNSAIQNGIPLSWKTAVITPIHKKGDRTDISHYRPISNLNSCSKLFEKIILGKLDKLGELDGRFQHGFKAARSTTTAMIEIQDHVAKELDMNRVVGMYSLDLTAAFDLLRPDIFKDRLQGVIPQGLLDILLDFLTERSFRVKIGEVMSVSKPLNLGCVQGSVLGPRLFTLYLAGLESVLPPDVFITSYADDTYICVSNQDADALPKKLEECVRVEAIRRV